MRNIFNGLYDRLFILTVVKNHYGDKFLLLHLETKQSPHSDDVGWSPLRGKLEQEIFVHGAYHP